MNDLAKLLEDPIVLNWLKIAIALLILILGIRALNKGLNKYVESNSTRYSAKKFINFIGYIVFLLFVIVTFNYKLSSLTIALGVAGAGITFALQEVIVSVAGFLAVLFGNFYKVGDRVKLGGIKGDVVDIGVLRTTLMEMGDWVNGDLYNGKMVRVANSFVFKEPVYNYSGEFPFLWDEIAIPIRHGANVEYGKELFMKILLEELSDYIQECKTSWEKLTKDLYIEKARIDPMVTISFDENWITFTLRYVVDHKRRRATKDAIYSKILKELREDKSARLKIATSAMEITQISDN